MIYSAAHQQVVQLMQQRLFEVLQEISGIQMPIWPDRGGSQNLRNPKGSKAAEFPEEVRREPQRPPVHN